MNFNSLIRQIIISAQQFLLSILIMSVKKAEKGAFFDQSQTIHCADCYLTIHQQKTYVLD